MKTVLVLVILAVPCMASAQSSKQPRAGTSAPKGAPAVLAKTPRAPSKLSPLKRDNPNQLPVFVSVSDHCNMNEGDALNAVRGVLIRSRIKPLTVPSAKDPFELTVNVSCTGNHKAYAVTIDFTDIINGAYVRFGTGYGRFGIYNGHREFLSGEIEKTAESAITDYMKINFNLKPE